MLKKKSF